MDEFEYIKNYIKPLDTDNLIGDDAAIIPDSQYIITKDVLIEDVHFFTDCSPYNLAKKSLRVNFSDIAAMGGIPCSYMLGLILPKNITPIWWAEFTAGLKEDNEHFQVKLLGGDTTAHDGKIIISITAIGINNGKSMQRSTAKLGDIAYVSGAIGDAALGLLAYQEIIQDSTGYLKHRYDIPQPRIALGTAISEFASSCIDISDGLMQDAQHICESSDVGMELYLDDIPLSLPAQQVIQADPSYILTGGDDYELLFTADSKHGDKIENISRKCGVDITAIGHVTNSKRVVVKDRSNYPIIFKNKGFVHFSER